MPSATVTTSKLSHLIGLPHAPAIVDVPIGLARSLKRVLDVQAAVKS